MAKRARSSKSVAAKQAAPAPAPAILAVNPKSFINGDTYNVGFTLQNFARVLSASFTQSDAQASFSNTTTYNRIPPTGAPQQVIFTVNKFSYGGTSTTSATITVTVSGGAGKTVTKPFTVDYLPKQPVAPVIARSPAPGKGRARS